MPYVQIIGKSMHQREKENTTKSASFSDNINKLLFCDYL